LPKLYIFCMNNVHLFSFKHLWTQSFSIPSFEFVTFYYVFFILHFSLANFYHFWYFSYCKCFFFPCIGLLSYFLFKLFSYPCTSHFSIWNSIHFPFLFMFFHSTVTSLFWFYSTFFLLSFMMRWLIFVLLTHFIQVC